MFSIEIDEVSPVETSHLSVGNRGHVLENDNTVISFNIQWEEEGGNDGNNSGNDENDDEKDDNDDVNDDDNDENDDENDENGDKKDENGENGDEMDKNDDEKDENDDENNDKNGDMLTTSRQCLGMAGEEEGGESLGGGNWSTEFDLTSSLWWRWPWWCWLWWW